MSKQTSSTQYMSVYALTMMNVAILAGLGNDPQQAFYGLSSVTFFAIGAIVFFLPTALVAAELAGGWPGRGGMFRWVSEGLGKGWGFTCLLILWFQSTFNLGAGMPNFAATVKFFTLDYDGAVKFAQHPQHELLIMCFFIAIFWITTWLACRGVQTFANISKIGVTIGTILPLITIMILVCVWLFQGHISNISFAPHNLIPKWNGMGTLALVAGVLFSYAGIDMNAAHINNLKNPRKQFPLAMIFAGIIAFLIFVIGTLIIAVVIPNKDINVIYALFSLYHELGATIHMPWLYMVFMYVNFFALIALWISNLAGPSLMLGQAGRSGLLPKWLQKENEHGMPSRMMYFQALCVTIIAFLVKLLPNVEGFFIMMTQTVTILYLIYYVFMFITFIRLRYTQPNRPRSFVVPGGKFGAWLVAIIGTGASIFGIVLAFYPPTQVKEEVGSPLVYVVMIAVLVAIVLFISYIFYQSSKKHHWVNKQNHFEPLTWEIEGLKKPEKVLSNIPTSYMTADQGPMGTPIRHPFNPNMKIQLPKDYEEHPNKYPGLVDREVKKQQSEAK